MLHSISQTFSVLDRGQSVRRNLLIEASAGTGKTFAIENIVARLLIDPEAAIPIEEILVVTFTKSATRDLKKRIRSNLERNLEFLRHPSDIIPDYLLDYIEKGSESVKRAKTQLEHALFSFDRAQIYTIHGFCWKMLKTFAVDAQIGFHAISCEETSQYEIKLMTGIRDFLRSQLAMPHYSPEQLKILMKRFKHREDLLEAELLKEVTKGIDVVLSPTYADLLTRFQECRSKIETRYAAENVVTDILALAQSYKGLHARDGTVKEPFLGKVERLAAILEKDLWADKDFEVLIDDGLCVAASFNLENMKVKKKPLTEALRYPGLVEMLQQMLNPIIEQARSAVSIFSRVIDDCRTFLKGYQEQEEIFGHNDLLVQMKNAVAIPFFAAEVRDSFSVVIVDEFQDTDPIQWDIFSSLFTGESWKGFLQLVGDPKQSIYAFRQADIYTYLKAAEKLGAAAHVTLDTNYRSVPPLIQALNTLFSRTNSLFSLPRNSGSLPFREVKAGKEEKGEVDPCLHFVIAKTGTKGAKNVEESHFFPKIADEIILLKQQQGISFSQCAILVADRYQTERLSEYLKERNIPVRPQRGKDLSKSTVVEAMRELIDGILHYQDRSSLNIALSGRPIGMTHENLLNFEDEDRLLPILEQCNRLKQILKEHGFSLFYSEFMQSRWNGQQVAERLLRESGGTDFYRQWQDLADLLISEEYAQHLSPYGLIDFLDKVDVLSRTDDERIMSYIDVFEEGVNILTTHVSKGLEFDVVFALGIAKRTRLLEHQLIAVQQENASLLYAPLDSSDLQYKKHCEEIDAEKMRQLYVAMTRAKLRLYVPVIIYEEPKAVPFGSASPIELLLARLHHNDSYEAVYNNIENENGAALEYLISSYPSLMTVSLTTDGGINLKTSVENGSFSSFPNTDELIPPKSLIIDLAAETIESFTSLTPKAEMQESVLESLSHDAPHDLNATEKTSHTIPAGSEVGILLHEILENISLHEVKKYRNAEAFVEVVEPFVKRSKFSGWECVIANMIYETLNIQLPSKFCLADVNPRKIYREMDFLYRCGKEFSSSTSMKPDFLKGVIDLFFEHDGKYYLVDWKSNWLGHSLGHYQSDNLKEAMRSHHYHLQAEIYAQAISRYLKLFDSRPFEEIFGGTYYLFLRGRGPGTGVLKC